MDFNQFQKKIACLQFISVDAFDKYMFSIKIFTPLAIYSTFSLNHCHKKQKDKPYC